MNIETCTRKKNFKALRAPRIILIKSMNLNFFVREITIYEFLTCIALMLMYNQDFIDRCSIKMKAEMHKKVHKNAGFLLSVILASFTWTNWPPFYFFLKLLNYFHNSETEDISKLCWRPRFQLYDALGAVSFLILSTRDRGQVLTLIMSYGSLNFPGDGTKRDGMENIDRKLMNCYL